MNSEQFTAYCHSKWRAISAPAPGSERSAEYTRNIREFTILYKPFAILDERKKPIVAHLKCDSKWAAELRKKYKKGFIASENFSGGWNEVSLDTLADDLIKRLIDHSYEYVVSKFSVQQKKDLGL